MAWRSRGQGQRRPVVPGARLAITHKKALEKHLKEKLGELFSSDYDLLLYDVTSTYFEGQPAGNDRAQRGYTRDHRPDCKQVNIALVVSRCGMPLGYELFAGNKADVTTVEDIVNPVEGLYGKANRIWVMDRGMASRDNVAFLREQQRSCIIGTPKAMWKQFERELLKPRLEASARGLASAVVSFGGWQGGVDSLPQCATGGQRARDARPV
ncbi:MAG: IS1634 family transposase [Acidobacteria bacterium]|nr:IS1634 family transposase [Bryobacteraceae bacterium CoA2 C42]